MEGREYLVSAGKGVAAGGVAAVGSSVVNEVAFRTAGSYVAAGWSAPIIEELTKSGIPFLIKGNVLLSHVAFGSLEGFVYAQRLGKNTFFDHARPILHAAFGVLWMIGSGFGRQPGRGILFAMAGHAAWNHYALFKAGMLPFQSRPVVEGEHNMSPMSNGENQVSNVDKWTELKKQVLI